MFAKAVPEKEGGEAGAGGLFDTTLVGFLIRLARVRGPMFI